MSHCRDCRWWLVKHDDGWVDAWRRGWGTCELTVNRYVMRPYAERDADDEGSYPYIAYDSGHPESLAVATDGESYRAALDTSPEFGCVQWEQKP